MGMMSQPNLANNAAQEFVSLQSRKGASHCRKLLADGASKARSAERHAGVVWKSQRVIQMWIVEDTPKQIYCFAMRPRMITKRPLDRPQCKRQKRIAAAV
jgi:hypothetical protein